MKEHVCRGSIKEITPWQTSVMALS
jgi:hypothetical protein